MSHLILQMRKQKVEESRQVIQFVSREARNQTQVGLQSHGYRHIGRSAPPKDSPQTEGREFTSSPEKGCRVLAMEESRVVTDLPASKCVSLLKSVSFHYYSIAPFSSLLHPPRDKKRKRFSFMNTLKTVQWNFKSRPPEHHRQTKPLFPFHQLLTQIPGLEQSDLRAKWLLSSQPNARVLRESMEVTGGHLLRP